MAVVNNHPRHLLAPVSAVGALVDSLAGSVSRPARWSRRIRLLRQIAERTMDRTSPTKTVSAPVSVALWSPCRWSSARWDSSCSGALCSTVPLSIRRAPSSRLLDVTHRDAAMSSRV